MARLIVKSPYIKCGAGQSAGGYLKYIATRERVEIIPDDRPPTNKQTVEMDMAMSILLQSLNVSEEVLRQERAKSIAAVKRTNGQLRLEQKLRELESEAWQD